MIEAAGHLIAMMFVLCALRGAGQFIYDFQTLLTGFLAVGAAIYAGVPVWRQLKLTQTEANGAMRNMLLQRHADLRQARAGWQENARNPIATVSFHLRRFGEFSINEHQAHEFDNVVQRAISWANIDYKWRDGAEVEAAKNSAIESMEALANILRDIHMPAHTEQNDEDHSIPDAEWDEFILRGLDAMDEAEPALDLVEERLHNVHKALDAEIAQINERLTVLDRSLLL